jgi:hypothetical protein
MADGKPFPSLAKLYHHCHFITHATMGFLRASHFLPPPLHNITANKQ